MDLRPVFREFDNDDYLVAEAQRLKDQGTRSDEMYVLAHDTDRTKRVANEAGLNTLGVTEIGIRATLQNLFMKKGDELRNDLQEIGLTWSEAEELEERLDDGKIFLIVETRPEHDSYLY
ncbi:general stress protein [Shimazuella sp. AN120528]|uniref:general stress protein n=1 Tax=Shimazuella soli TaxID=1892854 RepID=UPI001F0EDA32|nr:general stress protein [Shimazuella soli]MCH5583427.1 general stress protein [Shimazuella soli]